MEKLWTSSYSCLTRGLELFQASGSIPNQALLQANLGSLMRACASAHSRREEEKGAEFSPQERLYYDKAVEYYINAQQVS